MARLVGIHIDHPGEREREAGAASRVFLTVDRGLKSGRLDEVSLTEDQLLRLVRDAAHILAVLRGLP